MENIKAVLAYTVAFASIVILVCLLSWVFTGNSLLLYKFFAPKQEAVRREVFEQTKSFQQGIIQEIRASKNNYDQTDDPGKRSAALQYAKHQADQLNDPNVIPPDLASWLYHNESMPVLGR